MAESKMRFGPQKFLVDFTLGNANPCAAGVTADGSIALNDRIFVLQLITWVHTNDLSWTGQAIGFGVAPWIQDGLWSIDWAINNQQRFFKGAVPCALQLGSPMTGRWVKLPAPIALPGNETLGVRITNLAARAAGISVQLAFWGIERVDRSYGVELADQQRAA